MKSSHHYEVHAVIYSVFSLILSGIYIQVCTACEPMWYGYQGNCYRMFWEAGPLVGATIEARALCRQRGADLVTIKSEQEQHHVDNLFFMDGNPTNQAIIGLSDAKDENNFEWIDGTPLGWTDWKATEPNNYLPHGGEHCTAMKLTSSNTTHWLDVPCMYNPRNIIAYICEKVATKPDIASLKFNVIKDRVLIGYNTADLMSRGRLNCAMLCSRDITCLSASYKKDFYHVGGNLCRMNNASSYEIRDNLTSNITILGFDPIGWEHLEPRLLEY